MEAIKTKPKLLLADDSITMRKVVEMAFTEEGIEVFTASDGESAILKFEETQPDIVLADVGLSGTSGYQLCEMIKQREATRLIPVLLLVGSFERIDEVEAERVKADGHLTKPFASVRDVVARVKELLVQKRSSSATEPETEDIDSLYEKSFDITSKFDDVDVLETSFADGQFDDAMIETISPVRTSFEGDSAQMPGAVSSEQKPREFDWSPAAKVVTVEDAPGADERSVSAENGDSRHDEMSEFATSTDTVELSTEKAEVNEPSPEFIDLVSKRVIEQLADQVVREIALDVVPRIAEKIVREALGQDKTK